MTTPSRDDDTPEGATTGEAGLTSILILCCNALDFTRRCLESVLRHTRPPYELVVVDNASSDGTPAYLRRVANLPPERGPTRVEVLCNETNRGFPAGCNQALGHARGEYVLFLNNDTVVTAGWLDGLLACLVQGGDDVGMVGPVTNLIAPPQQIPVDYTTLDGLDAFAARRRRECAGQVLDVERLTGFCLLARRAVLGRVGGFDEGYSLGYLDDDDLSFRARDAGYRLRVAQDVFVHHFGGRTFAALGIDGRSQWFSNLKRFRAKWGEERTAGYPRTEAETAGATAVSAVGGAVSTADTAVAQRQPAEIAWHGVFAAVHSLAHVNRALCGTLLARGHDLALRPTDDRDPATPRQPIPEALAERIRQLVPAAGVHVYHQWPPDFTPPAAGHWVLMQPWEFGSLPRAWVGPLTELVDEVWVYSHYLRDCYVRSGIPAERVQVVPLGVDPACFHPQAAPLPLTTRKRHKFLFVGGTIFRKGIDLLLDAYARTFRAADDVCLVVKDLGAGSFYKGQTAGERIAALRATPGAAAIEYLDCTLTAEELAGLYTACDCLVLPYRGEGFGLPIAEAMACGLPVVVTGHGAALDFCDDKRAFLVPARTMQLPETRVGLWETVDYPWLAEPDSDALEALLRYVVEHPDEARARGERARSYVGRVRR